MAFTGLKRKYINWQIRKFCSKPKNKRLISFLNWEEVENVVVLMDFDKLNHNQIEQILNLLSDKEVSAFCFVNDKHYVRQDYDQVVCFNPKSVSFFQKPNKIVEGNYLKTSCDLLIDLTLTECLPMKYLAGISMASCRCGLKKDFYSIYDFEISPTEKMNRIDLLEQILHYLKAIKSKK